MIKIDVRSTVRQTIAHIRMEPKLQKKAQVRALNRTADQLRTEAGKILRAEYNVTLRGIRQASKVRKAREFNTYPFAEVSFSGRPINIFEFGARQVKQGVTVKIRVKGGRKLIKGAFVQTIKSGQNAGKRGVFQRLDKTRYPIRFVPSLSIPQMTERKAISAALENVAEWRFRGNFEHELRFLGMR